MKKILLTLTVILLTSPLYSQQSTTKDNINYYIGKQFRVKKKSESTQKLGYSKFLTHLKGSQYPDSHFLSSGKDGKKKKHFNYTPYERLVGIEFSCDSVLINKKSYFYKYYLVLTNDSLEFKCYYEFDKHNDFSYQLESVGGWDIVKEKKNQKITKQKKELTEAERIEKYCNQIHYDYDKFKGDTIFRSPYIESKNYKANGANVQFLKYNNGSIAISLTTKGSTLNVNEVGVTILLENNIKIIRKKEEINVKASNSGFEYSAFFKLSVSEIERLKTNKITDFRLFIYDKIINKEKGLMYQTYLKCIIKK